MNTQQAVLGFLGDINGSLAQQVQGPVSLVASSAQAVEGQDCLLIDGTTAPGLDPDTLSNILANGGLLAICNPTAEHVTMLGRLTGQTPAVGVPMVSFKKTSASPVRYKCTTVTPSQITRRMRSDSDTPQQTTASYVPDLGPILAAAALDTAALGMAPSGLVPPPPQPDSYTFFGYQSKVTSGSWNLGYPEWNNGPWDDNTAKGTSQVISGQFLTEFFVYWANGVNSNPYYVVIQRQSGPVSLGNVLANNQDSRGFFTLAWKAGSTGVLINGATNPAGVAMGLYAPQSASNDPQLPVSLNVAIPMYGPTQNGSGNVTFNAMVNDTLDYPQWAIQDQTSAGNAAWEGYQTLGWNPIQNPTWEDLYTNGNVVTMSDQSFGAVDFETFTSWTFDTSLFTIPSGESFSPPPALQVTFNFSYEQDVAFLHNHPGCSGNYSGKHFHIWEYDNVWSDSITFDLGATANQQSMGPS